MANPKRSYRFAVLQLQPSLRKSSEPGEPLALILETTGSTQPKDVLIIGVYTRGRESLSPLGASILENLPELLPARVRKALQSGQAQDVIGFLASEYHWNLFFTQPREIQSSKAIRIVGWELFDEHVLTTRQTNEESRSGLAADEMQHIDLAQDVYIRQPDPRADELTSRPMANV